MRQIRLPNFVFSNVANKKQNQDLVKIFFIGFFVVVLFFMGLWDLSFPTRDQLKPGPSAVRTRSLKHWTTREFPGLRFLTSGLAPSPQGWAVMRGQSELLNFLQLTRKILNQFTDRVLPERLEVRTQDICTAVWLRPSSETSLPLQGTQFQSRVWKEDSPRGSAKKERQWPHKDQQCHFPAPRKPPQTSAQSFPTPDTHPHTSTNTHTHPHTPTHTHPHTHTHKHPHTLTPPHTHRIALNIPFSRHIQYPMWLLHLNLSEKLVVENGKVKSGGAGTEFWKLVSANSKD